MMDDSVRPYIYRKTGQYCAEITLTPTVIRPCVVTCHEHDSPIDSWLSLSPSNLCYRSRDKRKRHLPRSVNCYLLLIRSLIMAYSPSSSLRRNAPSLQSRNEQQ